MPDETHTYKYVRGRGAFFMDKDDDSYAQRHTIDNDKDEYQRSVAIRKVRMHIKEMREKKENKYQ